MHAMKRVPVSSVVRDDIVLVECHLVRKRVGLCGLISEVGGAGFEVISMARLIGRPQYSTSGLDPSDDFPFVL